ncbi:OmpA family protein [Sphingomonas sp. ID1715]|uniref:OmpA family protein n=1 Tax=Sphingomonas sp. ID1715 TaxID=1656898 RepID=UPI00148896A1|nr:OmpA family protein [Sphingomonas sp. ID1715]NNM78349.1 OmpA family protein [Sphingomonas sp. ID1715]
MLQPHVIRPGMPVLTPDGQRIGNVDESDRFGLKLAKDSTPDGEHHYVAADLIDRVEADSVRLNQRALDILHGRRPHRGGAAPIDLRKWLPWILAGLLALILLVVLLQDRDGAEPAATVPAASQTGVAEPAAAPVALPNGKTVELAPNTLSYDVQAYLASQEAAPKTFSFDRLNFDTGRFDIRDDDENELENLARVLNAYPNARVRVVGYTDASGGELPNQRLAYARARSVARALTGEGVDEDRIEAVSGGESNPVASNQTGQGRFENRRTELIVLSR